MYDDQVRTAVAQYLTGALTEGEAARRAGLSRAQLRHYARTSGAAFALPPADSEEESRAAADASRLVEESG